MEDKFIDVILRIRRIGMYEKLESDQKPEWDTFKTQFMLSIHVQKLYSELYHFFQGLTIHTRDLLVAYMLIYYEIEETNHSIKEICKKFVDCIHNDPLNRTFQSKLYHILLQYQRIYIPWKLEDREKTLETLTHMYWEYEINWKLYQEQLSEDERTLLQREKKERQEECIHAMKRIDNLTYFHQFQPVYIDSKTSHLLQEVLRKAFWDRIKEGLLANPPEFAPLFSIFQEIQEHLSIITRFRPHIIEHFKDVFDIEFMQQQQQYGEIPIQFWIQRIHYLFDILIPFDSMEKEASHREHQTRFTEELSTMSVTVEKVSLCIDILAYITTRILEIRQLYEHVYREAEAGPSNL